MRRVNAVCTILLFWGAKAKPLRLTFPRPIFRGMLILAAGFILSQLFMFLQVATHLKEIGEMYSLRSELSSVREQKVVLLNEMAEVKRQVLEIKRLNWRFGVMLGQNVDRSFGVMYGKGGEDGPIAAPSTNQSAMLEQELEWLKTEASSQEDMLNRNITLAEEKSARWASTPTIRPVKGPITSGFGERISPFSGEPAQHNGMDIGARTNTPVIAPASGKVIVVKHDAKMGNVVRIDHGFGFQTEYRHLEKALVSEGQALKRGEMIGLVGNTGIFSTGPHLHYQVYVKDRPVNPQGYIFD
jgi:murein DD-endopeptidase MepM/ murein hydrolase activator NlpD